MATITITGEFLEDITYVKINDIKYASETTLEVDIGTEIKVYLRNPNDTEWDGSYVVFNGGTHPLVLARSYSFTVKGDTDIQMAVNYNSSGVAQYAYATITMDFPAIASGHYTLIDGVDYKLSSGSSLINGTSYAISKGRTLIDGTGYDINFTPPQFIVYDGGSELASGTIDDSFWMTIEDGAIHLQAKKNYTGQIGIGGIDFTKYSTLCFSVKVSVYTTSIKLGYATEAEGTGTSWVESVTVSSYTTSDVTTASVDISGVTGTSYYILAWASSSLTNSNGNAYIYKIWLE